MRDPWCGIPVFACLLAAFALPRVASAESPFAVAEEALLERMQRIFEQDGEQYDEHDDEYEKEKAEGTAQENVPSVARQFMVTLGRALVHHAVASRLDPAGVRREDAVLSFFRLGGALVRPELHTPSGRLNRRLDVGRLSVSGLRWSGDRLRGTVSAEIGRRNAHRDLGEGENMHSMLKANRKPVLDWHIGGPERGERDRFRTRLRSSPP